MRLPRARGPLSRAVVRALGGGEPLPAVVPPADGRGDAAVALWTTHELQYRGFEDVDPAAAERPDVFVLRVGLERELELRWRRAVDAAGLVPRQLSRANLEDAVRSICAADLGPSVARHVQRDATLEEVREIVRQRTIYHAKEQDPATWVIPRVPDETKAHLAGIAADEYGNGRPAQLHARLWADGVAALGLDARYGAYVDDALPEVLEQANVLSTIGLTPRLRGAALGHLAAFEVTSSLPSRAMCTGLGRLGAPAELIAYYEEHTVADAVHEQVAVHDMLGSFAEHHPRELREVAWGAALCVLLESRVAEALLAALPGERVA